MEAVRRMTAVAIGKAFEERSLSILQSRLSMSLRHVGGSGDSGVDIQGWWWVPKNNKNTEDRRRIRVLAQCKAFKKRLGPVHVRELEGAALLQMYSGSTLPPDLTPEAPPDLIAMLLSSSGFTPGTIRRAMASPVPFMLLHLPVPESESESDNENEDERLASPQPIPTSRVADPLGSILWNPRLAGTSGILGGNMEVRWELGRGGRPVLYWHGQRLKHWVPEMESN